MSPLDHAIATHLAHGAGACADPLTDSLAEQCTQPAALPVLRAGWEHEPAEPPAPLGWMAAVAIVTVLLSAPLSGCGGGGEPCHDATAGPPAPGTETWPLCHDDGRARITPPNCTTHPELCR